MTNIVDLFISPVIPSIWVRFHVYAPDQKTFINMEMVKAGWASPMTIAPNVAHAEAFVAAHRIARAEGRGIWKEEVEE